MLSSAAVTPLIGQSRDARKQGRRDGRVKPQGGEGDAGRREGNRDADERKGSDRFGREVARETEARRETEAGNPAGVPSTSASSASAKRYDDSAAALRPV